MERQNLIEFRGAFPHVQKEIQPRRHRDAKTQSFFSIAAQAMAGKADEDVFEGGLADGESGNLLGEGLDEDGDEFGCVLFFEADGGIELLRVDLEFVANRRRKA